MSEKKENLLSDGKKPEPHPQKWWACKCGAMTLVVCSLCQRASQCPNCDAAKHGKGVCDRNR